MVGDTLAAVGEGRRDVRTALTGDDEIARLGRQVDDTIDRLDREERMRRELFAAVSHDLRTPITALSLLATAIDDEVVEDAKRREYAARMNTHVRALGALIDDLFDLTRLQAQELQWTMERIAVEALRRTMRSRRCARPPTPARSRCGPTCARRSPPRTATGSSCGACCST